ncbi:MAG: TAXI family TRAP transporter solute-binding subunit [Firmicutes bacterium]|nr:TAXI family TRAP transporter solute-binding subunit [Bacillota bacterium]
MKKIFLSSFVFLTLIVFLCSCTVNQTPVEEEIGELPNDYPESEPPHSQVRLTMATGNTSGTYYPYGGVLALAIEASTGYIKIIVSSTGASEENVQQISSGIANLAIVQNDVLNYAYNGTNNWSDNPVKEISTLMSLYPEVCQLIVSADSGINSVADLKGKRISIGDAGSGVQYNALQILEAYGLSAEDLQIQQLGFSASADGIRNNTLDGFFATSGLPNNSVLELATSHNINLIGLDDNKIGSLISKYPYYTKTAVSEKDYGFLSAAVNTVSVQATLVAGSELEEQVAYDIVKAIIEYKENIMVAHAKGAYIDPKYAVQGISVSLHPGAKKYFQELGVL